MFNLATYLFAPSHLAHLALTVSSQEGHVVDLIHDHKVLLLSFKVLQQKTQQGHKKTKQKTNRNQRIAKTNQTNKH